MKNWIIVGNCTRFEKNRKKIRKKKRFVFLEQKKNIKQKLHIWNQHEKPHYWRNFHQIRSWCTKCKRSWWPSCLTSYSDAFWCSYFGLFLICCSLDQILQENSIKHFLAIFGGLFIELTLLMVLQFSHFGRHLEFLKMLNDARRASCSFEN